MRGCKLAGSTVCSKTGPLLRDLLRGCMSGYKTARKTEDLRGSNAGFKNACKPDDVDAAETDGRGT